MRLEAPDRLRLGRIMVDRISKQHRSWNMSRIRSGDTKPELIVRSLLHRLGYRFRLHRKDLPGSPDIVLPRYRTVVFVHGCFWHRHQACPFTYTPKSRTEFWQAKFDRNVARDREVTKQLKALGWRVLIVWECEMQKPDKLARRLERFLTQLHA
ncbi:very short patch repair endonuclease [Planctellipticum variicoloris]|uniref:very short patch repair endonuclease n=1 Tax=Planctellipticum variicoloris TaxID=3064265 RepID=UPI003AF763EE